MNRKTFIRSVEAVIAIILFIGFYNIATQNLSPSLPRADPTILARELLNSMEQTGLLEEYINTYALRELTNSLKYLLPPTQGFKIELDYLEPLVLTNTNNYNITQNISFIRFFPETTNLNSVNVFDETGDLLPIQLVNNYYKIIINAQTVEEIRNSTITLNNINLVTNISERINSTSLEAFINAEETSVNLNSIVYNSDYYDANASITILVPYASANSIITINLFYAYNNSSVAINYPSLPSGESLAYTTSLPVRSKASEVRFRISLEPNEERTSALYYELNTESSRNFNSLTPDNNGVEVVTRNDYYASTLPLTSYQSLNTYNVKKSIVTNDLNCLINFKVWNYE